MKTLILACAVAFSVSGCHAQEKREASANLDAGKDSRSEIKNEPRGTWKVNKEVDENGNLVRYDSIYTYSYGTVNGKEIPQKEMDSALASFQKFMQQRMPKAFSNDEFSPFLSDSINGNFFEKDFFKNNWEEFFPEMQEQLRRMDSLHEQFFKQAQPGLFPPEESKQRI